MAAYISVAEKHTNIRGELRASLIALEGCRKGECMLICPDYLLVVNGVLGWVQCWRRHGWTDVKGPVQHKDLWETFLCLLSAWGSE